MMARPKTFGGYLKTRVMMLTHRKEMREMTTWDGGFVYATAYPLYVIQHLAPNLLSYVTFCGKWADGTSTGEMRTKVGWTCRKCVKRALKSKKEVQGS